MTITGTPIHVTYPHRFIMQFWDELSLCKLLQIKHLLASTHNLQLFMHTKNYIE